MPASKAVAPQPASAVSLSTVLERAPAKDRANLQRHLDALATEPTSGGHAKTWETLLTLLAGLAPHALQTVGKEAVRFFVSDGRYKLQVYALEDKRDGLIRVYLPDVIDRALRKKVMIATKVEGEYALSAKAHPLHIEALDGDNQVDPPAHFKFMIGLGRKALRLTLEANGNPDQIKLTEALCQLAASGTEITEAAARPTGKPEAK